MSEKTLVALVSFDSTFRLDSLKVVPKAQVVSKRPQMLASMNIFEFQ